MKNRIRLGMIGGGKSSFIGIAHRIASYMGEDYDLIGGAFDIDYDSAKEFAAELDLDVARTYPTIDEFISSEKSLPAETRIQVVSILTPNNLHYSMAKKLIEAGFNVICEKPVTITYAEAVDLSELVARHQVNFCLTHTYTGYPMVRQMKKMIADGSIGKVQKVDAQYYQGWINPFIHSPESRKGVWRLNPEISGISCCMGDIGVHAFNMVEYTIGLEVKSILADLNHMYDDNPTDVDGTVLLRFDGNLKGVVRASQVATGEENALKIAVYGDKGGLRWEQENPTYLHFISDDKPTQVYKPGNDYNSEFAQNSTKMAPGHPEGIFDAMGNIYSGMAKAVRGEKFDDGAFPGIYEGVRGMKFIEEVVASNKDGNVWKTI